ncbi:meiosis-specific serine/threonine-protein kinase mek1, partial [Peziza echinospora]
EITCSNYHFRIYSIMFERSLPPLIYCEDLSTNGTFLNGQKIGKHNRALLSEGDKLEIRHSAFFKFHSVRCSEYNPPNLHHLEEDSMLFSSRFVITDRVLGQGGYGTIHMARNLTSKELKQVACKVLRFDSIKSRFTKQALFKEVEILMSLNHPNIINLMEVYSNSKRIYVFEELITGGDLWSYVQAKDRLAETDALPIMWQVVEALIYLHGEGIAHRDLKPENILLASTHPGRTRVVLADFGTARMVNGDKRMTTFVGTIEYTAPEVTMCQNSYTLSGYDMAADIWSLGNILYMILRGYPLFAPNGAADRKKVEALAAACDLGRLNSHEWKGASPEVKDLLRKLIVADPKYRLAAPAVKQHRWFSRYYDVLIEGYE